MRKLFPGSGSKLLGLLFVLLVTASCGAANLPGASSPPASSGSRLTLTVVQPPVSRTGADNRTSDLQEDDNLALQPADRLAIGEKGRALLKYAEQAAIELFSGAQVAFTGARSQPDGADVVQLKLTNGYSQSQFDKNAKVRLVVDTDYATVTGGGGNAQLIICEVPGVLTCIVSVTGDAQVAAKNQTVNLRGGEATYVFPNQAPRPAYCANLRDVRLWLESMRSSADTTDLASLLIAWPQQPCAGTPGAVAQAPGTVTALATLAPAGATPSGSLATVVAAPTAASLATRSPALSPTSAFTATPAATTTPAASPTPALPLAVGMVKVPAGHYQVGGPDPDENHVAAQTVDLPEYWIDHYEVTNAQFQEFLTRTGRAAPASWPGGAFPAGQERFPAAGLTWQDAADYCAWANKRLPSEAEWETAGRGPGPNAPLYPWGTDPTAGGKTDQLPLRTAYPVGSFEFNKSPFGAYDMTGSLWQWVGEPYAPVPPGLKILRGGRHGLLEDMAYRQPAKPDDDRFTRVAGVRCAADRVAGG